MKPEEFNLKEFKANLSAQIDAYNKKLQELHDKKLKELERMNNAINNNDEVNDTDNGNN